jgi:predicted metal-dependent HD superfamily phosphohydrolase
MDLQSLLNKWKIKADINVILDMWNESHRKYHSLDHLNELITYINESKVESEKEYEKLILTSIFHDVIYDPIRSDNEERSSDFFLSLCQEKNSSILEISQAILDTKSHVSTNALSEKFNKLDMCIVEKDFDTLLKWEEGIFSEFSPHSGIERYKEGRLAFLESLLDKYNHNAGNLLKLINWVKSNY